MVIHIHWKTTTKIDCLFICFLNTATYQFVHVQTLGCVFKLSAYVCVYLHMTL